MAEVIASKPQVDNVLTLKQLNKPGVHLWMVWVMGLVMVGCGVGVPLLQYVRKDKAQCPPSCIFRIFV